MPNPAERLTEALAGRYRIERELGQGGMATVYLAQDIRHDREVAVKVLHADLGAVLGAERFLSEIKTTARLQHPHILPLLDSGEANGLLFYVMPYVRGETLRARLERERQLPIDDAIRIAREVADALGAAHAQGIIHRDIKPENIMLEGKARRVLVMDFGIAKVMDAAGDSTLTSTGTIVGTPHYMSPEQASGDPRIDARTDQYSLAVVGYHMLTGSVPFEGESTRQVLFKQMMETPRSMRELVPEVPHALMEAVSKAMSKEAAQRFVSMEEFATAIEKTIVEETRAAALAAVPPRKRSRATWMATGAGLLAVAAIVAALVKGGSQAESRQADSTAVSTDSIRPADSATATPPAPAPGTQVAAVNPPPPPPATNNPAANTAAKRPLDPRKPAPATPSPAPAPAGTSGNMTCARVAASDDRDTAFRVCTQEAEGGNPVSQRLLAGLYDQSQVPTHAAEAASWYRRAAEAGDLPSMLRYGQLLSIGKGVDKNELDATAKIRQAAEADYQPAWLILADRFEKGLGARRSDKDAAYWVRKAAEKGEVTAQARLGDMYMRGKGVDKDETEGVRWFRLAADKGNRDAQYELGMSYLRGRGNVKSDSLAYSWLGKAAEKGHPEAQREVQRRKP